MRSLPTFAAAAFLACATSLSAQSSRDSSQSQQPSAPPVTEIEGRSLDQWIKDLTDRDPSVRLLAVQAIARFGPSAKPAIPKLVDRMSDLDTAVRVNALLAVGSLRPDKDDVPKAVAELSNRLKDQQAVVRLNAAAVLTQFGTDARPAIPALLVQVRDQSSWEIRRNVALALRAAGYPEDKNSNPDPRAIEGLVFMLANDPSAQVRLASARALGELGRPALVTDRAKEEQVLVKSLTDKDQTVVIWSYVALMSIADNTEEKHLVGIARFLKNPRVVVRRHACEALAVMKSRARSRIPDLIEAVKDSDPTVAGAAGYALGQVGITSEKNFNLLGDLLKNPEPAVRRHAAGAVGFLGADAKMFAPQLLELLQDKQAIVVTAAAWALSQLGELPDASLAILAKLLEHPEVQVRTQAAQTLGMMGAKAKTCVPDLMKALQDKEAVVATYAALALATMGQSAAPALPALQGVLQQKGVDENLKMAATGAIEQIRKVAK